MVNVDYLVAYFRAKYTKATKDFADIRLAQAGNADAVDRLSLSILDGSEEDLFAIATELNALSELLRGGK